MSEEFSDKVAIVTGSSSGLGQATAVMLARKGAMMTLCGRDEDRLRAVLEECAQASGGHRDRFITVRGDVTDAKVREDTVAKTVEKFGRLDILVANAGILLGGTLGETTKDKFDALFNVNVKSVFFLIQAALPHLEKSKGNIVSNSSCAAKCAPSAFIGYAMTKATLDHMTRCLALDLGPKGIRVNAVNPSFIPTRITRDLFENPELLNEEIVEKEKQKIPLGEGGTCDDVARAICFLASDSARFITGECMSVDGGRAMTGDAEKFDNI